MIAYKKQHILDPLTLSTVSDESKDIFDHVINTRNLGFLPNMFGVMGHSPGSLQAVASVGEHVRFNSSIDKHLIEIVICEVSVFMGNEYEWCHHILKVPEKYRSQVGAENIETEPSPVGPALRFVRLTLLEKPVPDGLIADLKSLLNENGLVELTVMVGYYQLLGTFCVTMGIQVEGCVEKVPMPKSTLKR